MLTISKASQQFTQVGFSQAMM
uniref:Uncharacterized protein n=1 Tax=Rhizophora mucronata TaxID=61149 RepID=A0A2P2MQU0_RHIMU